MLSQFVLRVEHQTHRPCLWTQSEVFKDGMLRQLQNPSCARTSGSLSGGSQRLFYGPITCFATVHCTVHDTCRSLADPGSGWVEDANNSLENTIFFRVRALQLQLQNFAVQIKFSSWGQDTKSGSVQNLVRMSFGEQKPEIERCRPAHKRLPLTWVCEERRNQL